MSLPNKKVNDAPSDPYFDDVKSKTNISFDFVIWIYRILKYWYLFVISVVICLGIAYIKNKSWIPTYTTQAMMMLQNKSSAIVNNAVPTGALLKNANTQQVLLSSYGMTERTVSNLPMDMRVDYFHKTRFKMTSLYSSTPVHINIIELQSNVYNSLYNIEYVDENSCRIFYKTNEENETPEFDRVVKYGDEVTTPRFKVVFEKTKNFFKYETFNFRFLTDQQLINMYHGRVGSNIDELEGSAMSISMVGSDPNRDIDYLTVLLDEFQKYNLVLKNQQADSTIAYIDKQLRIIGDSLESSRKALDTFQRETGVYEVTSNSLRKEIDDSDGQKEKLALREQSLLLVSEKISESILGNSELIEPTAIGVNDPLLNKNVTVYNAAIKKAKYIGPKNPLYKQTVSELNEFRTAILKELQILQTNLQEEKDNFVKDYELLELKVDNLPPQERALVSMQRIYKVNEIYHQYLMQRKYEAQIQRVSNAPDNYIWEPPRLVSGPINKDETRKNYTFFLIVGMLIPLAFVVLKEELLNFTIATKEECEKISGFPVIGAIENISRKMNNGVVLVRNYPKSSFAESFRNMRIRIEYIARKDSKIAVLVTSAEPGDGKTFIATNLASVYHLTGKKVVIVDLDLRRPAVSKTLKIDSRKGVSNYLIGQVELEEIIISDLDFGFDVIPSGTLPPNPSELIKTDKTREMIDKLKEMYDFVIIDCSPMGLVSDAYILSRYTDAKLFVVRRAKTNKSFFKSIINQVRVDEVENVALIFNDVKGREGYYGTSRYYGNKTYYLKKNSYYHDDYFEN